MVTAAFLTEDFYPQDMWALWDVKEPLTLNRYNYCAGNPLYYVDRSGHWVKNIITDAYEKIHTCIIEKENLDLIDPFEVIKEYKVSLGNVNYVETSEIRNEWLRLYEKPTVTSTFYLERQVKLVESKKEILWCNHEYLYSEETAYINPKAYQQMIEKGETVSYEEDSRNFVINDEGRYWVAVGPRILIPDYPESGKVWAQEFEYGTKVDIIVSDVDTGDIFYIPVIVGDVKNHTYPNGMYHTGNPYPNSGDVSTAEADYSYVEFIRTNKDESSPFKGLNLKIEGITVYEKAKEYE